MTALPIVSSSVIASRKPACAPKAAAGSPTWIALASHTGVPTSCATSSAISSVRAVSSSAMRVRYLPRSSRLVAAQPGNAAFAAATALATSSALPSGIEPMTCSVAALVTSSRPVPVEAIQLPSTKIFSRSLLMRSSLTW